MSSTEAEISKVRVRAVGAALFTTVAAMLVFLQLPTSDWRTACVLFLVKDVIYAVYAIAYRDRWMQRIFLFLGILVIFNFGEDWLLVAVLKATHYQLPESHPPTLWHTPIFGILAWPAMTMELAVLGAWLVGRWRWRWRGVLLVCAVGMVAIPFYDELAIHLHWWRYDNARLLGHTPYFVIFAESLLAGAGLGGVCAADAQNAPHHPTWGSGRYLLTAVNRPVIPPSAVAQSRAAGRWRLARSDISHKRASSGGPR